MKSRRRTAAALVAVAVAVTAASSILATPTLDDDALSSYIDEAIEGNPELRAARERVAAARARVPQLGALPEPELRLAWLPSAIQTRTGPQRVRVAVSQMFPWFGVRDLRSDVGEREASRREIEIQGRAVELVRRIKRDYYDYAYLAEEVRVTRDNLELLQQLEPVVQRKFQTGSSQEDLLRLQMEIGRNEDRLLTLVARRPVVSARLAASIGRTSNELLPWPTLTLPQVKPVDRRRTREAVSEHNLELALLQAEIEREEAGVALARQAARPSFGVGLEYMETGAALNPSSDGSGDNPFAVSAMVKLPLWRPKYRSERAEATARREDARLRRADRENHLRAQLERAAFEVEDADRKLALYRDTLIPRARQTLALTGRAYQAGTANILDWIGTERELLDFDLALYRAAADYYQAVADLEALCGGELP